MSSRRVRRCFASVNRVRVCMWVRWVGGVIAYLAGLAGEGIGQAPALIVSVLSCRLQLVCVCVCV